MAKKQVKKVVKKTVQKKQVKKVIKKTIKKTVKKNQTAKKQFKNPISKKTNKKLIVTKKPIAKKATASPKSNVDYTTAVTPLGDRLVVRLAKAETMTSGGLYIPEMVNSAAGYLKGEVLVVGQGHTTKKGFLRSMDVQKGDQILFAEHSGTKVIFNSEELHIVNETDVLGIIQK